MSITSSTAPTLASAKPETRLLRVAIIGAGFGGLGMAIRLKQAGFYDFTIFERGDSVGGVWRANTYPGAACDVPSHLYSLSFAPGHQWTRRYAPQADIHQYMNEVADEFGLRSHLRLRTEVTGARFDEEGGQWELTIAGGENERFDALVAACGQLSNPATPGIAGIDDFEGTVFHSAKWDHSHDLTGERVAVIGTGASAIQFVPAIAERVAQMDVYQRSAPWILPKMDRGYPAWERALMKRFPLRVQAPRAGLFAFFELGTYGFTGTDWLMDRFSRVADNYRESELPDPELRAKATPDYQMGCKRVLFTSDWYSTLRRDNVELVTCGVERITARGVLGRDDVERPADTIIWGTGFRSHDFVAPMEIRGLGRRELNEVWRERPEAYLGTLVHGFPNFFVLWGPNTNHGSGSVPFTLESQFNFAVDALEHLRSDGLRYLDLKQEVQQRWREEIDRRSAPTRWVSGGCTSWYVNDEGVNTNNWPGPWLEFRRRTRRIDPAEFDLVA